MPTWGEILNEIKESAVGSSPPDLDGIRRKYLAELHQITGRPTIIYYSDWIDGGGDEIRAMTLVDVQGFMEAVKDLEGDDLDLILHLPGGSAEATCRIIEYLRRQFKGEIRAFVPLAAMSAGTMLALGCDKVIMGAHSQLGPIDPQIPQQVGGLIRYVPTRAIIQQFDRALEQIKQDVSALGPWTPILRMYGTSLLAECEAHEKLAKSLVRDWLCKWMLRESPGRAQVAAEWFANFEIHLSHSRGINREEAREQGIVVEDLELSNELQDAVLSVHHSVLHTFQAANAVKIIENHLGKAFIRSQQPIQVAAPKETPSDS